MQLGHQSAIVLRLHIQLTSRRFDCAAAEKPGVYCVNCMRALSLELISSTRNKMAPLAKKVNVVLAIAAMLLKNCGKVVCGSVHKHTYARSHARTRTHSRMHAHAYTHHLPVVPKCSAIMHRAANFFSLVYIFGLQATSRSSPLLSLLQTQCSSCSPF